MRNITNPLIKAYGRQAAESWSRRAARVAASPWVRGAALALGWLALVAMLTVIAF